MNKSKDAEAPVAPVVPDGGLIPVLSKRRVVVPKVGVVCAIGICALSSSAFLVEGGHRAIVFNMFTGVKNRVYREGIHFKIPLVERVIKYDVRSQLNELEITATSHDLRMVGIGIRVLARPNEDQLPTIYNNLGENYAEKVLPSIIHEALKTVVAKHDGSELITKRDDVIKDVRTSMDAKAAVFNILIDDVAITSMILDKETPTIDAKVMAAREAEGPNFFYSWSELRGPSRMRRAPTRM